MLKTKTLETLSEWHSQHQITHLPLWFWQIPWGWSQNMEKLDEIMEFVDCHEYGLPLPIPILVSDGRDGVEKCLMKCGDRYYIFIGITGDLHRVEEPAELAQVLRCLGRREWKGLKLTECYEVPEYGGTNQVPDEEVPSGWSNVVEQKLSDIEFFRRHGITLPSRLLFREASCDLPVLYLVDANIPSQFYLWDISSDEVCKIERPEALQDILDTLMESLDNLTLSRVEPRSY